MAELLVDASVAVPLLVASHEVHDLVVAAIGGRPAALAGHALHETFAVLTRLPGDARVAPSDAVRLLDEGFEPAVLLDAEATRLAPAVLADNGISGGAVYDGLVALAARSANAPLVSRDRRAEATYRRLGVRAELLA